MKKPPADHTGSKELRKRAEKRLHGRPPDDSKPRPENFPDILQELRVHQVELELQNEELRRTREELEESRDLYFDLYDLAPVGYLTLDEHGIIRLANLTVAAMLGLSRNELIKRGLSRFIDQKHYARFAALRKKAQEEGSDLGCELAMIRADAEPFFARLEGVPAQDAKGKFTGWRAALINITESKQAEADRGKLQRQLSNALEMALLGPWEYNVTSDIFTFNDHFYKIFHTTAKQVGGYTMSSAEYAQRFVHPDDIFLVGEEIRKALETSDPNFRRKFEHRMIYADGTVGILSVQFSIVKDAEGRTIKTYGVNQDITERTKIKKSLLESETRLRRSQEVAKIGTWEFDLGTDQVWGSDQAFKIFGLERTSPYFDLDIFESNIVDSERVHQALVDLTESGSEYDLTYELRHGSDGKIKNVHSIAELVRNQAGQPVKVLGTIQDVSNQVNLEAKLRQAQKMEAVGTLAGGIAHDFNNILAAMMGYTELALDDLKGEGPVAEKLRQVLIAGNRAAELVRQILYFSRIGEQEDRPLALSPLIKESLKLLRASLPATIEIQMDLPENGCQVLADPVHIHQIVMNLCTNAAQSMAEAGGVLAIGLSTIIVDEDTIKTFSTIKAGRYHKITVSDNGIGMTRRVVDRAFEPFFTTKEPGQGTGMGLAVVQGIVQEHGGDVSIYSEVGKGTTVNVFLPALETEHIPDALEKYLEVAGGTERIILVDDEKALAEIGLSTLQHLGYAVTAFTSSQEALEKFKAAPDDFDLVISDYTMPEMTGAKLSQKILALRPDTPIIICTGFSQQLDDEKAKELGIRKLLMKPLSRGALARAVREALDGPD
ncbi:MAG: PAS domain S-box protein [Desulfarculus sp.]|nr:PAS domain S-box protein [Pseudomonadota bacterium]MBU4598012.1 PAS domain S-box protein [Pseudomonadota bacterium]MBV1714327.1 PAS domain S-box protein [Desulfarculus sp.]MBV1740060.1 PAS domain S-box protein [Desulfarculus sp.]MBV1751245.1 PAS domain S-box protein [Desulfarculus sp.]